MKKLPILLLVVVAGCGSTYWFNSYKTLSQAKIDCYACDNEASRAKASIIKGIDSLLIFEACMEGKGYIKVEEFMVPSDLQKVRV